MSYCSAPPLKTSSRILLPPRPTRAEETRRPRAPLRAVKAEVRESESESVEFIVDEEDDVDVKPDVQVKIEPNPRHITAQVAAIAIRQPDSAASTSSEEDHRPIGPNIAPYRCAGSCPDS